MSSKTSLIALVALAGALSAGTAQARGDDLRWSVTIGSPGGLPVYQPAPTMILRHPVAPPRTIYEHRARWDADGDGIPNYRDRLYNPRWDIDGDGIPNRQDRIYNPRWDRDGDGIPNRQDRVYNPRWDRDGDGVPNRRDPRPDVPYRGGWGR